MASRQTAEGSGVNLIRFHLKAALYKRPLTVHRSAGTHHHSPRVEELTTTGYEKQPRALAVTRPEVGSDGYGAPPVKASPFGVGIEPIVSSTC